MYRNAIERLEGRVLFSTLPAGFTETTVATLPAGTHATMAFAPDGRLFVADTTNNQIRLIKGGALQSTPVLNLAVAHQSERGINGIAFDPNFATAPAGQKYVYVYYTTATNIHNRLSRFTISASNADTLDPASEKILIDNIASTNGNHNGGSLHFGADGKLYLGVGEAGVSSNAQTLANDNGKVLRINPDGTIPSDNPFIATAGAKPEIWALGFRNPFTSAFKPGTSQLYVNDVGEHTFEEIDLVQKGGNFGWPTVEGVGSNASFVNPIYNYRHATNASAAITGGVFYNGSNFPASYNGKYFFGDFVLNKIWTIDVNSPPAAGAATVFASSTLGVVDLDVNPIDGSLWYLDVGGKVQKIAFNQTPPPTNTTLTATAAAYVKDGASANTNFGSTTDLQVKKSTPGFNRETFLKFDLSSISNNFGSAKLRVFGNLSSTEQASAGLSVFAVASTTWGENTITFANKPVIGVSQASGAITGTTPQWYEFDVTAYAKAHAGQNISFDLKGSNNSLPIMTFNSDEAATNKPQLVISATSTGTSLPTTADAYVRDGSSANTNFGAATTLQVKKSTPGFTREAYLRFDLSSVTTINSAKLRLFGGFDAAPGSAVRIAAFGLDNPAWTESGINYTNRPTGGTQLSIVTFTDGAQASREWDLTSYLKAQKAAGKTIVTIALRALDGSTPAANFASDEAAANKPQLVIS